MEEYPFSSYSGIYQANQIELQKKIQKIVSQCMIKKEEKYLKEMVRILKFENNISYRVIEKSLNLNREKLRKLIIYSIKGDKMEVLEEQVLKTIKKYKLIENKDKIVLGVSGGPDSICMLHLLNKLYKKGKNLITEENCPKGPSPMAIMVAHVNHMIRAEANDDEKFVRDYCEKNKIEFYTKSIDVQNLANTNKIGIEEAGRLARYEFFEEILQKTQATKIAIAHNKNDKVETILMHTLRGSGMKGLKGIEPKRGNIIRPFIECDRSEIERYCEREHLNPRIDKSNFENIYHRNKIRNVVIPYIQKEFNPNIIQTINRLSDIMVLEDEYMEKQTKKVYRDLVIEEKQKEIIMDLKQFNLQELVIKSRLIRYIIKRLFGTTTSIEKIHIDDIIKLCNNNVGNKYLMPNKNIKILVKSHKIYFILQD